MFICMQRVMGNYMQFIHQHKNPMILLAGLESSAILQRQQPLKIFGLPNPIQTHFPSNQLTTSMSTQKKYPSLFDQAASVGADTTFRWTLATGGAPGYYRIYNLACKGSRAQIFPNCNIEMGKRLCDSYGGCPAGFSIIGTECRIPRKKWDYNCERIYSAKSFYYEKVLDWAEETNKLCNNNFDIYENAHFDFCKWMCMARNGCPNGFSYLPSTSECRLPKKSHNWDCKPGSFQGAGYYKPLNWKVP